MTCPWRYRAALYFDRRQKGLMLLELLGLVLLFVIILVVIALVVSWFAWMFLDRSGLWPFDDGFRRQRRAPSGREATERTRAHYGVGPIGRDEAAGPEFPTPPGPQDGGTSHR